MSKITKDYEKKPYMRFHSFVKEIEQICSNEDTRDAVNDLLEYHRALSPGIKAHEVWAELGPFIESKLKDLFLRQKLEEMEERILNKVKDML